MMNLIKKKEIEMSNKRRKETFFTSDLHLGHFNIIKYSNRPFTDIEQMNNTIINNINEVVMPEDDLWILGDFFFGTAAKAKDFLQRINCNNLHFTFGNHDKEMRKEEIRGFFKSMDEYKEIKIIDPSTNLPQNICMMHFPILEWNQSFRGSWMLHGHTHGNMKYPEMLSNHKIIDVGVDRWNYYPVSYTELKKLFKDLENK